jgi:hypothetical protein
LTPTARSLVYLRRLGYVADPVERFIAAINRRRDFLGCIDIIAAHPRDRAILALQVTSLGHVGDRLKKALGKPELAAWVRSGGLFQVWGWGRRGEKWFLKRVEVRPDDLAAVVIQAPPPRRRPRKSDRQRDLFDGETARNAAADTAQVE